MKKKNNLDNYNLHEQREQLKENQNDYEAFKHLISAASLSLREGVTLAKFQINLYHRETASNYLNGL